MPRIDANLALFHFKCAYFDDELFQLVSFNGYEEISRLYRFELQLVSRDREIDFAQIVNQPAKLTIMRGDVATPVQGIVIHFEQAGHSQEYFTYRAVMVPRLWRLTLVQQSRIFQRMAADEIIRQVLQENGFAGSDIRVELQRPPKVREYCVQYRETDFNFISRLMEREGIFYYFEHGADKDTLVITDDAGGLGPIEDENIIGYDDSSSLAADREVVQDVIYREGVVTGKFTLNDYFYREPGTFGGESNLNSDMPGQYVEHGDHLFDTAEGSDLAKVRNEEIESRRRVLQGRSNCAGFRSGYKFSLEKHFRDQLNQEHLITRVEHQGSQRQAMGLTGVSQNGSDEPAEYRNTFTCIPASVPFRPARLTPVPQIPGVMTAKVQTDGGDYAFIDENGEYHVKMPFDPSGTSSNGASLPVRLSQPYSGPKYGIHFPNHVETDMVVAYVNGDIDRPIGLGTVPNPSNESPVTSANRMQNVIRTMAGNEIVLDDTNGASYITIKTTDANSIQLTDDEDRIVVTTTNKHTVTLDDTNRNIELKTTDGHFVLLDDKNKKLSVQSKDGHLISISDQDKLMTISDKDGKNKFVIDIGNKKLIILSEEGSIDLHAPKGKIDIKAKELNVETTADTKMKALNFTAEASNDYKQKGGKNLTSEAGMDYKQKGGVNLTSEAGVAHKIKGVQVKSEGSAMNDVAGAMVNVKGSATTIIKGGVVLIN